MMFVVRRSEESVESGGGEEAFVTIRRTELEELRSVVERLQAEQEKRKSDGAAEAMGVDWSVQAREQELLRLVGERERQLTEKEKSYRSALKDRELASTLAGSRLVPGAAAQLIKLWSDEFEVLEEDGRYRVVSRDGRSVGQVVEEWLGRSEFAHFCQSGTRGGTGARGAERPTDGGSVFRPTTLGEAIVERWRDEARLQDAVPAPIGLNRRRK